MEREIKFRLWDSYFNEYSEYHLSRTMVRDINTYTRFLFEQFTGLKDKNGKEIYEGDILRTPQAFSDLIIVYNNESAGFGYRYIDKPELPTSGSMQTLDPNLISILGNIHQNPELI